MIQKKKKVKKSQKLQKKFLLHQNLALLISLKKIQLNKMQIIYIIKMTIIIIIIIIHMIIIIIIHMIIIIIHMIIIIIMIILIILIIIIFMIVNHQKIKKILNIIQKNRFPRLRVKLIFFQKLVIISIIGEIIIKNINMNLLMMKI